MSRTSHGTNDDEQPTVNEHGYAPYGAACGHIIEMDGRYLSASATRVPMKADGEHCSVEPKWTYDVAGIGEVALCHHHRETPERLLDALAATDGGQNEGDVVLYPSHPEPIGEMNLDKNPRCSWCENDLPDDAHVDWYEVQKTDGEVVSFEMECPYCGGLIDATDSLTDPEVNDGD